MYKVPSNILICLRAGWEFQLSGRACVKDVDSPAGSLASETPNKHNKIQQSKISIENQIKQKEIT